MRNWADTYHQQMDRFTQSLRHKSLRALRAILRRHHRQGCGNKSYIPINIQMKVWWSEYFLIQPRGGAAAVR